MKIAFAICLILLTLGAIAACDIKTQDENLFEDQIYAIEKAKQAEEAIRQRAEEMQKKQQQLDAE